MNPFEKKAISPQHSLNTLEDKTVRAERWVKSHLFLSFVALVLGILTLKGVVGAIRVGDPFSVKQIFVSAIGDGLHKDGYGHTNILLLGVGGEGHDGARLTDTMIVASIDSKKNRVSMLSIPRDLYVENETVGYGSRINSIYQDIYDQTESTDQAEAVLEKQVEEILEVDVHYYAKIDFKGFTDIVDAIDGITVDVQKSINDESYPAPDGSGQDYDPFHISAGTQEMDGETALKYARSRHVEGGDFDRARRQQEVIAAIKEKALSLGVLTSPSQIKGIYSAITANFETNLSLTELVTLVNEGADIESKDIHSAVISDEAWTTGGFLYTPEREEGDPFYLAPYTGDFSEIQLFAQLFFYHPEVSVDQVPLKILNGTHASSLAGLTKMMLTRYGFNVVGYGNASTKEVQNTTLYLADPENEVAQKTADILPSLVNGKVSEALPLDYQSSDADAPEIVIELGQDFADYAKEHDELFYVGFY